MTLSEQLAMQQIQPTTPASLVLPDTATATTTGKSLPEEINTFKLSMIAVANERLEEGKNYLDTKELKDLNSIVKDLEASTLRDTSGPTINIVVQNMLNSFSDDI